ncbi:hypothetical protein [Serratia proteamaculans]|uniref:hypothetical protein n=1 Tax=Serratia proteamaculans TaxID=28151 RepID=UPI0021BAFBDF|nr:hypothetical protein [Serratia proteamaculans]
MDKDLVFDYGQTPPGMINKTLVETLSINCTGKTSIKLTLQKSNQGKISLGSSGLTATLQANDLALGSRISLLKGTSPVRISSALSGNTSASGPQAGSGVLILDVLE